MDPNLPVGRRTRLLGRAMLPFGVIYLVFAVLYFGYYLASGELGAFHVVYAGIATVSSAFMIVQGWSYWRDPRFR